MIQIELHSDRFDCSGINDFDSGSLGSGIRRELSFSHWCDDDGRVHLDQQLSNADASIEEDSDFELPFLQKNELQSNSSDRERFFHLKFQQRSMQVNGAGTMVDDSISQRGNGSEKYVPFDIENKSPRRMIGVDSSISMGGRESLGECAQNPISVANILKTLFFILMWLETPSFRLSGIILIISVGILLTVAKETQFEFWGFILVMLAAVMSGFRWCMTQILLQKEAYGLKNPLTLMSYVSPVMAVATALISLALDPWDEFRENKYFDNSWHITRSCLLMLFGGALAFFMVLTEYVLVSVTSAVTVTIAGVVKEAVTILVAVLYFHDEFTWLKGFGLLTILFGVSLFNWYKYQKLQKAHTVDNDMAEHLATDSVAKYVILEELDEGDDSI